MTVKTPLVPDKSSQKPHNFKSAAIVPSGGGGVTPGRHILASRCDYDIDYAPYVWGRGGQSPRAGPRPHMRAHCAPSSRTHMRRRGSCPRVQRTTRQPAQPVRSMVYSAGWLYGVPIHRRRRRVHWVQSAASPAAPSRTYFTTLRSCLSTKLSGDFISTNFSSPDTELITIPCLWESIWRILKWVQSTHGLFLFTLRESMVLRIKWGDTRNRLFFS